MLGLGNQPAGSTPAETPKPQARNAWIGPALGIGGLVYDAYRDYKSEKNAKKQFNEQMDNSVTRRVEDAKKAGVHPLFALGASVGASPTIQATQNSQVGANLGRIVQDTVNRGEDRDIKTAQIRALNAAASADEALAIQRLSVDSIGRQGLAAQGRDVLNASGVEVIPDLQIAARAGEAGTTAGTHPMWRDSVDDSGLHAKSMSDETLQQFEDVIPTVIFTAKNPRYVATKLMQLGFNPNKYRTLEKMRKALKKFVENSSFGVN